MEECLVRIPRLPAAFEGFKIALFSDIHLYPFTPIQVVQDAVRLANFFRPDLVILTGDFVWRYVSAAFDLVPVLSQLNPARGTFAVLGNHDHRMGLKSLPEPWPKLESSCFAMMGSPFKAAKTRFIWPESTPFAAAIPHRLRHSQIDGPTSQPSLPFTNLIMF
jgi:predicted MPP superfamily phosphohydrolase